MNIQATKECKAMTGYVGPIEAQTLKNVYFRQVLFTGQHAQRIVMCLQAARGGRQGDASECRSILPHRAGRGEIRVEREGGTPGARRGCDRGPCWDLPYRPQYVEDDTFEALYGLLAAEHPDWTVHKTKIEAQAAEAADRHP